MDCSEIIEALDDLKHDLGKYLVMPLSMLETDAGPKPVREAVTQALLRTRTGPNGTWSAAELWQAFALGAGAELPDLEEATVLTRAVGRALAWQERLEAPEGLDRAVILADFRAVSSAIDGVIAALASHGQVET